MRCKWASLLLTLAWVAGDAPDARAALLLGNFGFRNIRQYDDRTGAPLGVFASTPAPLEAIELVFGPNGDLYVTNFARFGGSAGVFRYDGETGEFLGVFVSGLALPSGATFGPDGDLYVSSGATGAARQVLRFDGVTGESRGVFVDAVQADAFVFGPDGNLYLTQSTGGPVLRFDGATGAPLGAFTPAGLDNTRALVFGPDGDLFVSDWANDRVLRYDGASGAFLGVFAADPRLDGPNRLAFGPDGNLYVVGEFSGNVVRFDGTTGRFVDVFVQSAPGAPVAFPIGLAFTPGTPGAVVPEPGSLALGGIGAVALLGYVRRRGRVA